MKVLITGAFGFVGTNLSAYLAAKGHDLWALDVESGLTEMQRAQSAYRKFFHWGGLDNIPWNEVDAVVHLAGKAHDTRNASDPQSYLDINVGLTKKVIVKFSRQDAKAQRKFILFSSVKAVADRVEGVLTEDAVPNPQTAYGKSKLEAEGVVRSSFVWEGVSALVDETEPGGRRPEGGESVGNRQSAIGTDSTHGLTHSWTHALLSYILRPCMIHGPGNRGNLNLLYGVVRKGIPWPLGAFENRRSFASIGNVCAVVEGLLTKEAPAGVYQVADDETLSTNELIGLMARSLGKRPRIWRVPAGVIRWAARCGDLLGLPLNSERLKKLTESYVASNAKIKAALGWTSMPIRAEEGMRETLESFSRKGAKSPRN